MRPYNSSPNCTESLSQRQLRDQHHGHHYAAVDGSESNVTASYYHLFSGSLLFSCFSILLIVSRRSLLSRREHRQIELDRGVLPEFLSSTESVRRDSSWSGPKTIPADLQDRRVEITGPVDRKMIINALNSGAKVFMADFEGEEQ